jgi:hypothetical protein
MKKILMILFFVCAAGIAHGQNIQFLYGWGNGQPVNFVTVEMYKTQDHGALYYWTDFKLDWDGYFDSYTEISKYWFIGQKGFSATVQYNAGIFADGNEAIRVVPVYLAGVQKAVEFGGWNLSLDLLYRYDQFTHQSGAQTTFVFMKQWKKFLISGYCDVWNSGIYDPDVTSTVAVFEPQIFYSITKRWAVGIEGRISNYTLTLPYKDYIMAGLRWDLE